MSITLLLPFLYLFSGMLLSRIRFDFKRPASTLLTRFVIPIVIIYNISASDPDFFLIIIASFVIMALMLQLAKRLSSDPVEELCFCYLNIGWLALPLSSAIFGNEAASVMLAFYVGSSLQANLASINLFSPKTQLKTRLIRLLKAPHIWALLIGVVLIPFKGSFLELVTPIYIMMKFLMSAIGMMILGAWLIKTRLSINDFKRSAYFMLIRMGVLAVLITFFVMLANYFSLTLVTNNLPVLYLLCFLPPAAYVVVLETQFLKTGKSAKIIASSTLLSFIFIIGYILILISCGWL
ncbi:AEC family transporter [Thorsellia anophelis]|uniref:Permease n=1 Tax=Thorsellia anophelis DSM 18579 TaxID=1123402 RepID=A0A1I0B2N3_9GAMM|nr:hypothetical protein [Thorsellia anophelis]SET01004.1 hypothetical protein SAMN02583745_01120 [Thorsellia anophelis DSM 18579]